MPPENGRHWTNPTKVIWGLLAVAGFLLVTLVGGALAVIQSNGEKVEVKVESNEKRITEVEKLVPVMQEQYKGIKEQLGRIEGNQTPR